jgi:hypothetical protein
MPNDPKETLPTMFEHVAQFEKEYHLADGFLKSLLRESDWSFVIKIHALLEASVSKLLAEVLDPKLLPVFKRIELSNKQIGKLRFADALGVLGKDERRFIYRISELRNDLVHDISQVEFSFKSYIEQLDPKQLEVFTDALTSFSVAEAKEEWTSNATNFPKETIWLATIRILIWSSLRTLQAGLERSMMELTQKELELAKKEENVELPSTSDGKGTA